MEAVMLFFNQQFIFKYTKSRPPSASTKVFFNERNKSNFTLSFDSWVSDKKQVSTGIEYQIDIGSASNVNVPLYLKAANRKTQHDNHARSPN